MRTPKSSAYAWAKLSTLSTTRCAGSGLWVPSVLKACADTLASQDSFAGLFQRKDPREAGPRLDIERALAKLEKVRRCPLARTLLALLWDALLTRNYSGRDPLPPRARPAVDPRPQQHPLHSR